MNRRVFIELGKSEIDWGSSRTEGVQNGVGSEDKGGEIQKEAVEKRKRKKERKRRKKQKRKEGRFSTFGFERFLSSEGGFPKVLKEVIPGFGGRKERRQRGSS